MSTQRTINRSLIIQRDLALGTGQVLQDRGSSSTVEQKIELVFIFRTLDEIRYLDWSLYTRIALHTAGQLVEYIFDITSSASDDADDVLAPLPVVTLGRWLKVSNSFTTTELADIADLVNTSNVKQAGYMAWNSVTGKPVWAVGAADGDVWVDATGSTAHTPA